MSAKDLAQALYNLSASVEDLPTIWTPRVLRRLYARAIRLNPPEGNAEAFMRVRAAYELLQPYFQEQP